MRYVALSINKGRANKLRRFLPEVEILEGVAGCYGDYRENCIPLSYRDAAIHGYEQGWDKGVIFMQDDVWLPHGPGFEAWFAQFTEPLVILGTRESSGLVAPKAYAAEPFIWEKLTQVWTGEGRIMPAWNPLVEEYGIVLDVARQL